jgi:hypothetical protein
MGDRRRVVVHRPDPPDEEVAPKLSRDEVRALLAVARTTNGPSRRTLRRGGVALVVSALLSTLLDALLGWWSIPIVVVVTLLWFAIPLVRQRRDGWM